MAQESRLSDIIAATFPGAKLVHHEPLIGGVSAKVTRLELVLADGTALQCALREHGDTHNGHPADLEFDLLTTLHGYGLPVARPLAYSTGKDDGSLPWVLSEYAEGTSFIPAAEAEARIAMMAWQLAAIHTAPTHTLPALPERGDPHSELLSFLPKAAEWEGLRARIAELGPQPYEGEACLLHGDYWPANIIWRDEKIAAVIDWEDAAIGDPLSDVACAQLELRYVYGPWGADRFRSAYEEHRAVDAKRLAWWQAYVAAAGAKSMGDWGLDPGRVTQMRGVALQSVRDAARVFAG